MSFFTKFINAIRKNERGNITIETIYIVPLIMWTTLAFAMAWEYYRAVNTAQRATYAVADIISRERVLITDTYITSKYLRTFAFVNGLSTNQNTLRSATFPAAIRVTSVELPIGSANSNSQLKVLWSMTSNSGRLAIHTNSSIQSVASSIPSLLEGDSIVVVETLLTWAPRITARDAAFGTIIDENSGWISAQTISVLTTIRPRFVPRLCATTIVNNKPVNVPCEL